MSNGSISPSAIDGIRRYAAHLTTSRALTEAEALDAAAAAGGFQSFADARQQLEARTGSGSRYVAYVSVRWQVPKHIGDMGVIRAAEAEEGGQEILTVPLTAPLDRLLERDHLKLARYLHPFEFAAADHLDSMQFARSQESARRLARGAARTLTFVDATELRPARPTRRVSRLAIPGHDHSSVWYHLPTKIHVMADEPYAAPLKKRLAERAAWSAATGWDVRRTAWTGIYNPGFCELYLVAERSDAFDVDKAIAALDALPHRFVEENWEGRSVPQSPRFLSPVAMTEVAKPQPPARPKRAPTPTVIRGARPARRRS